jgi:hypothetical protein
MRTVTDVFESSYRPVSRLCFLCDTCARKLKRLNSYLSAKSCTLASVNVSAARGLSRDRSEINTYRHASDTEFGL